MNYCDATELGIDTGVAATAAVLVEFDGEQVGAFDQVTERGICAASEEGIAGLIPNELGSLNGRNETPTTHCGRITSLISR